MASSPYNAAFCTPCAKWKMAVTTRWPTSLATPWNTTRTAMPPLATHSYKLARKTSWSTAKETGETHSPAMAQQQHVTLKRASPNLLCTLRSTPKPPTGFLLTMAAIKNRNNSQWNSLCCSHKELKELPSGWLVSFYRIILLNSSSNRSITCAARKSKFYPIFRMVGWLISLVTTTACAADVCASAPKSERLTTKHSSSTKSHLAPLPLRWSNPWSKPTTKPRSRSKRLKTTPPQKPKSLYI